MDLKSFQQPRRQTAGYSDARCKHFQFLVNILLCRNEGKPRNSAIIPGNWLKV